MDSITHIVIGAAQGELLAGKKLGKKAMLWGAIANSLPDIDVLFGGFHHSADSMFTHRGITHSILFAVLMAPLLGYVFNNWFKEKGVGLQRWIIIFALGLFTHIFIDALTTYGTGWYEPFSHYRVSFNTIFVADPFYTFPLLISFIALLILKKNSSARKAWTYWGLLLSSIYMLFTFYNKYKVDNVVRENLAEQHIVYTDYFSTPTPLNNFLWYAVVKGEHQIHLGYYSILDRTTKIPFYTVYQNDSLLNKYSDQKEVQKLIHFSGGYYSVTKSDSGDLDFHDLRFGQIGGWTNPSADFVFSYHLKPNADNNMVIQGGRFKGFGKEPMKGLIDRIKGRD